MNTRLRNFATVILVGGFVAIFSLWAFLKPDDEFSISERRYLAAFPALNSDFGSKFESYATDQFPLRDGFRRVKALTALGVFQKRDNNDIYVVDGSASELNYPLSESSIKYAAERFRFINDKFLADAHSVSYAVIPDKNSFLAAKNGYPAVDLDELKAIFAENMDFAKEIDLSNLLTADDFYRTDSHWRQEKLLPIAKRIAESMGVGLSAEYDEISLDTPFRGVYYGRSALPLKPDNISYLTNDFLENLEVYDAETDSNLPVYDLSKADGRDPYELFLSGAKSLLTVENPDSTNERGLVIFRDSFGSSLSPLLFEGWSRVTIVDIRYIMPEYLGRFIDFADCDVLFIYSSSVLNSSGMIK